MASVHGGIKSFYMIKQFWTIGTEDSPSSGKVNIDNSALLDFCVTELGYYNYIDYSGAYVLVKLLDGSIIKEARVEDLKQEIKDYLRDKVKREAVWNKFIQHNYFTEHFLHNLKVLQEINFNSSTKDVAHYFYKNGVVLVDKSGSQSVVPYKNYKGYVWFSQISTRSFQQLPANQLATCEFAKFIYNISGKDKSRMNSLASIVGYILQPYKEPSNAKALILLDENTDTSGRAMGGTGKSLLVKGLGEITSMLWKDGKRYQGNETFGFDDLRPFHRILYFDDVKANFSFDDFYSAITGSIQVKRKYRESTIIPFSLAPKLVISSNHMVIGTGGVTDERRRIEFEVSSHYSLNYKPSDEFGHNLFDDWDEAEWTSFDNLMLSCVSYYLKQGIVKPSPINLKMNKLLVATNADFFSFIEENIAPDQVYDKAALLAAFVKAYPGNSYISGITFKKWLDSYAEYSALIASHTKSNGKSFITFKNDAVR